MCFAIALLHSALNERSSYSQCGWNESYIFGEGDYDLAIRQLTEMMK